MKLIIISLIFCTIIFDSTVCWPFFLNNESIANQNPHDLPFHSNSEQDKKPLNGLYFQNHGFYEFRSKNYQEDFGYDGSFIDFANQMVAQNKNRNKILLDEAIDECKLRMNKSSATLETIDLSIQGKFFIILFVKF